MNIDESLKYKVENRKFAMDNLGLDDNKRSDSLPKEFAGNSAEEKWVNDMLQTISNGIDLIEQETRLTAHRPIFSCRPVIGKCIVFSKKVVRKLLKIFLGWYINPILEQQSKLNKELYDTMTVVRELLRIQEENHIKFRKMKRYQDYTLNRLNVTCDLNLLDKYTLDYMEFENQFRGNNDDIKNIQRRYIHYYMNNANVLDIGCGRGEFLELLRDNGITAKGIDTYLPFVDLCKAKGLDVENEDALTYLNKLPDNSLGGIFMAHVVEHLSNDYLIAIINVAYQKLMDGCYFILETPNSENLSTFNFFYSDLDHIKPVHYLTLEFLFKEVGYTDVMRYNNDETKFPIRFNEIKGENIENIEEFNTGIRHANEFLFGYRDYTLIAKK